MIAVLVVIVVFVKVLEHFGLLETSYDGKHKEAFFMLYFSSRKISLQRYFVRSESFVVSETYVQLYVGLVLNGSLAL